MPLIKWIKGMDVIDSKKSSMMSARKAGVHARIKSECRLFGQTSCSSGGDAAPAVPAV